MAPTSSEPAGDEVRAGYYINKHGILRKKNGPASCNTFAAEPRSSVKASLSKTQTRTEARIWISSSELADLNELRRKINRPLVVLKRNSVENQVKMGRAETANRRRKMLEFLKLTGQSTHTEKAKLDLFVTENFKVEGDGGFMNLSLFDALELPREWLTFKK